MQTVTIDIINHRALKLLQDLELMQLIRFHKKDNKEKIGNQEWISRHKGTMTKQVIDDVNSQLNELRNEWE
jgi:hypothetical protein